MWLHRQYAMLVTSHLKVRGQSMPDAAGLSWTYLGFYPLSWRGRCEEADSPVLGKEQEKAKRVKQRQFKQVLFM